MFEVLLLVGTKWLMPSAICDIDSKFAELYSLASAVDKNIHDITEFSFIEC